MTCVFCEGSPYPWNCERCNPIPPPQPPPRCNLDDEGGVCACNNAPDCKLRPPKRLTICERCWTVIAIDGENNLAREPQLCSHLGPFITAVTT
jgi:hypothetical protein